MIQQHSVLFYELYWDEVDGVSSMVKTCDPDTPQEDVPCEVRTTTGTHTQHSVGESPQSFETQFLEHVRVPHFHPAHNSVRLENAHKILLDFNFSSSPGRRIFQTLRQFVQSDKRIISETHTLWTSTAKHDLFSFHLTNYFPWDKSHHTKLQLRMRFS